MVSDDRFKVTLVGGAPWGFRLSGGAGLPLIINKIRKKSQAHVQNLREGDAVISINGVHVHDKTQDEALELVEATGDTLTLEIFRGAIEELSPIKPRKAIHVHSYANSPGGTLRLQTTSDDGISPGEVVLIPSGDGITSSYKNTSPTVGAPIRVLSSESTTVRTVTTTPARYSITSSKCTLVDKPVANPTAGHEIHSATSQPQAYAKPFFVSQTSSPSPDRYPTSQGLQPLGASSKSNVISAAQAYSIKAAQSAISQPRASPQPPAVSPKPQVFVSHQPPIVNVKSPGVTSTVTSSTFDDGRTHREITREQHVQQSDTGKTTTFVQRETTTTTTTSSGRPHFVKNQASVFNSSQPRQPPEHVPKQPHSMKTSLKSSTNISHQKGPAISPSSSILQPQFQPSAVPTNRGSDNQFTISQPPLFKPTKFVPGSGGKKSTQNLYTPRSPIGEFTPYSGYIDGKENVSPSQPLFQIKNIVSDKPKSPGPETWRPNMWLPGQQPTQAQVSTSKDDDDETFPSSANKPGYSLVQEQKRKLMSLQTPRPAPKDEYNEMYNQENQDDHGHHKHGRLHVFAPPVEIHAEHGVHHHHDYLYDQDDYDDAPSSPESYGTRKKNLYADSAFYDTPGKSYPTITEQMKLCKTIAQSLTSSANKRARGAKMFMKRKRKSTKWIHEGHSELSSSAGDVANLHELDSELNQDDGGNKPLLFFKIPSLKNRIGDDSKQTKMALTQEQFEKLRLSSNKCDHKSLPPDPCFDIVADLKAHKGKGGRMFERRKQRSDKFVHDETNAKFSLPRHNLESSQDAGNNLNPREVAMRHGWKGEPISPTILIDHQNPPVPIVHSSLKSEESPCLLKGKNFNRTAKGWSGGGEYPVADRLQHISPTRELGPSQSRSDQQIYNKGVAHQAAGGQFSAPSFSRGWPQEQQNQSLHGHQRSQDDLMRQGWGDPRQAGQQGQRPKSWHTGTYPPNRHSGGRDGSFTIVDYMNGSGGYPNVAYKQPIIPGTDL